MTAITDWANHGWSVTSHGGQNVPNWKICSLIVYFFLFGSLDFRDKAKIKTNKSFVKKMYIDFYTSVPRCSQSCKYVLFL